MSDVADAVLLFGSADVDEFSLAPSFVAPANGVTIAEAQALLAASNAVTDSGLIAYTMEKHSQHRIPVYIPGTEHGIAMKLLNIQCSIGRRGTMGIIRSLLKVMATA